MAETGQRLADKMLVEGEKTVEFFRALSRIDLERTLYADGGQWTVGQVLAHFVGAEIGMTRLVQGILNGGEGSPEDFDLNLYNERKVASMEGQSAADLLAQFAAARQASAAMVRGLSDADLACTGRHPWLGVATLEDILKLMYRHNQIHQRDIRKALSESPGQIHPYEEHS